MRVAIARFGSRVSPRFDCASAFLVVTIEKDRPVDREELVTAGWMPRERTTCLVGRGVDAVICGGIDWWSAETLKAGGIALYGGVTGEIEDALAALIRGELTAEALPRQAVR